MTHKMSKMSGKGDELVCEWNETTTQERLNEIEREFNTKMKEGFFAANLSTNELIKSFDPSADILLIPRVSGGRD